MKKILLFIIVPAALIWGCNKDQRTVNKLEGGWVLSSMTKGGSEATYIGIGLDSIRSLDEMNLFRFMICKVKKDSCYGEVSGLFTDTLSNVVHAITYPFTYIVDKKNITMFINFGDGSETIDISISDQTKEQLILNYTSEGDDYTVTLNKAGTTPSTE